MSDSIWVPVDAGIVISYPFQASQSYIDNYATKIVDPTHISTPSWWHTGVIFIDVSTINPVPFIGAKLNSGVWTYPPPSPVGPLLSTSAQNILADGKSTAIITYQNTQTNAPTSVLFNVNETVSSAVTLVNGIATLSIVSTTPGDVITVTVETLSVKIMVAK